MLRLALIGLLAGGTGCDLVFGLSRATPDAASDTADAATDATPGDECADPTLRLCMLFEDELSDGQAIDSSTQQNHASLTNVVSGSRGTERAATVTATSMISIGEDTSLDVQQPATISAWFFSDSLPTLGAGKIVLDNDAQYAIAIAESNQVRCGAVLSSRVIEVKQAFSINAWHHVACVYQAGSPSTLTMYLDGIDVGSDTADGPIVVAGNSGTRIGQNAGTGGLESGPLTGLIDDVKIWGRALTALEVQTISASE